MSYEVIGIVRLEFLTGTKGAAWGAAKRCAASKQLNCRELWVPAALALPSGN